MCSSENPTESHLTPKQKLRGWCLAERKSRPDPDPLGSSIALATQISQLPVFKQCKVITGYLPILNEVSPVVVLELCHNAGYTCAVPAYVPLAERRSEMETYRFCQWTPTTPLVVGRLGISEPAEKVWVELADIDLFLVPGLAFDNTGTRLGFGSGIYDRLLGAARDSVPRLKYRFVGVCYDWQVLENIPCTSHDVSMDAVVTPTRVMYMGMSGRGVRRTS